MMFSPQTLRFSYYKWFHQTEGIHPSTRYSDFSIPPEHRKVLEEFMSVYKDISLYIMVIDSNVFRSFILDLEYFHKRSLITVSEMEKIRIELYEMLDYLETIAANGVTDWGCKLELYLSPIVIDSIYSHFEYEGSERSQIWLYYCVDSLTTTNLSACSLQKDWIDSLKRYSTLISKSGEMQRIEYFNHQRQLIKDMGKR